LLKADSLYFQFADQPISLAFFMTQLDLIFQTQSRFHSIVSDLRGVFVEVRAFRHAKSVGLERSDIFRLHFIYMALKHRSVIFASDEALCVGTLMSVSLPDVTFVLPESDADAKIYQDEKAAKEAAEKAKDTLQLHVDTHSVGSLLVIQAQGVFTTATQNAAKAAKIADISRRKADSDLHIARMRELWLLLSTSLSGLSADLIFFREASLPTPWISLGTADVPWVLRRSIRHHHEAGSLEV
jgi:hypothetical protein